MEVVASRVEQLEKSKIQPVRPAQTTPAPSKPKPKRRKTESAYAEWDQKKYKGTEEERRKDRENRRLLREQRRKAEEEDLAKRIKDLAPLGEDDDNDDDEHETAEKQTEQEEAPKKKGNKETPASRNKRMEMERRRTEKAAREAEKAKATEETVEEKSVKSPAAKKAKSPGRAKPTVKSPGRAKPTVKSPERAKSTVKSPKSKPKVKSPGRQSSRNQEKRDDDTTNRKVEPEKGTKPTGKGDDETSRAVAKKKPTESTSKTATKHIDDDDYDLDLRTGKFVKKKKQKPPVLEDDDDDDLEEIDDVDKDLDYDPDKEDDQGDEDDDGEQEPIDDDDDDFPIPPIRVKKQTKGDKSTKKRKQTSKEAIADLADFVEDTFGRPTRQSVRKAKGQDACINPEEAARFQKAMKAEALELEKAVRKGRNVATAYKTLVTHVIEACKDMKYDIPADLEADDIFPTIADPNCKAWTLKMQGIQTAGEGELNVSKTDNAGICVAKKKYSIGDVMSYAEEVSSDWNEVKRKNFLLTMKKVMGNMTVAHRMVADASQELINLLDEVELPLWIKLADITMRPLVHLEIPDVVIMCEEAKQVCKANEQSWDQTTKITAIMESQCLPFLPTAWGYDREGRAKKVVAGIIYKYVKDRMYDGKVETPATEVSEKFGFNATTINRHILGKKYAGGKASGSGTARRPAAIKRTAVERKGKDKPSASASKPATDRAVEKLTVEGDDDDDKITKSKGTASKPATDRAVEKSTVEGDDDDDKITKSKGKGKSSGTKRPAKEIRDDSKSKKEKERAKRRKTEEAELDEELVADPDMPTSKEKQAAMEALAAKGYKQKGVIIH